MPRARNIKPGFFKNEVLAELKPAARLLFIGLWTLADREGRLEDRPLRIKAEIFPYDAIDVKPFLESLSAAGFIIQYKVAGRACIQINNFCKHQNPHYKEVPSAIPPPAGHEDSPVVVGGAPESLRLEILKRDGNKCKNCGATEDLTLDHINPRSLGGTNDESNLQTLCRRCNASKNNRLSVTSSQRRTDDDSMSAYDPPASPADILNPESLILNPESLLPITESPLLNPDPPAPPEPNPVLGVVFDWNALAEECGLSPVKRVDDKRKAGILSRLADKDFDLGGIFEKIKRSDFLRGSDGKWRVDFDFVFCSAHNYVKILEGKYDNGRSKISGRSSQPSSGGALRPAPKPGKYAGLGKTPPVSGTGGNGKSESLGGRDARPAEVQGEGSG